MVGVEKSVLRLVLQWQQVEEVRESSGLVLDGWQLYIQRGVPLVAQKVKSLPAVQETWVRSLGREDPLEKGMATHSIFFPGEFHGQRSLAGYSPSGHKGVRHD